MRTTLYITLLALLLTGCKKEHIFDCMKSTGKDKVETRDLQQFSKLEVYGNLNVQVVQAIDYKVEITAGENIISGIACDVKNGILTLENQNTCNVVRGYKREINIVVYMPFIQKITNEGVGTLRLAENFAQDSLSVRINSSGDFYVNGNYKFLKSESNGNGDMYLNGSAESLYLITSGTNYVRAKELKVSNSIFVVTRTLGDVFLTAAAQTQVEFVIEGKGNIYLYGSPNLVRNLGEPGTGGQLIQQQ